MSDPRCTAFTDVPLWRSPVAEPVRVLVGRLQDWHALACPPPEVRDALHDIVGRDVAALHAALIAAGQPQFAADLVRQAQLLLRTANSYVGAAQDCDRDGVAEFYVRVCGVVDGLIAWLQDTDRELCPPLCPTTAPSAHVTAPPASASADPAPTLPGQLPKATHAPAASAGGSAAAPAAALQPLPTKQGGVVLSVDPRSGVVSYRGHELKLPFSRGFRILAFLAARPGRQWEFSEVVRGVWGDEPVQDQTVDAHVANLRRTLRQHPEDPQVWSDLAGRIGRKHRRWQVDLA